MGARLNPRALDHALRLVRAGRFTRDPDEDWNDHLPASKDEARFRRRHGDEARALWFLGVDVDDPGRPSFPYGDFSRVHACAVLAAARRAEREGLADLHAAAARIHTAIEDFTRGVAS
jgi:hypothetical protein